MPSLFGVPELKALPDNVFTHDLQKSATSRNPTIIPEIDCVWVLSGRSTVLGNDADGLQRAFDRHDDLQRMQKGIVIATRVNVLRAGKNKASELTPDEWVTPIFYNGRKIHNRDLKQALKVGRLAYPPHLFIIEPIDTNNTLGQIRSFKNYFSSTSQPIKTIAVVSSAYHIPRVARTIGEDSPQIGEHPSSQFNFLLFGINKRHARPGIVDDVYGESRAMQVYTSQQSPSISRLASKNTFMNDSDLHHIKALNRAVFWHQVADVAVTKTYTFALKNDHRLGQLRLLTRPDHIQHQAAREVLVDSFIGEYQQYLDPQDISVDRQSWRGEDKSVAQYYQDYYAEELHEFLAGKVDYWVEARVGGRLVGWATFLREKGNYDELYMNLLIVSPDYQGKSIGTTLVKSIEHLGIMENISAVHVLLRRKNQGGREFYSKQGFISNPEYTRAENFVDMNLLEPYSWFNPELRLQDESSCSMK